MKYAIIKSGIVDNIVEWDGVSEYQTDEQLVLSNDDTYIGGSYTNNAFVPRYTQEELDQMEAEAVAAEEAKAAATAETEAKLEALGLTKADLAVLLG
jgi:hypothetical protein